MKGTALHRALAAGGWLGTLAGKGVGGTFPAPAGTLGLKPPALPHLLSPQPPGNLPSSLQPPLFPSSRPPPPPTAANVPRGRGFSGGRGAERLRLESEPHPVVQKARWPQTVAGRSENQALFNRHPLYLVATRPLIGHSPGEGAGTAGRGGGRKLLSRAFESKSARMSSPQELREPPWAGDRLPRSPLGPQGSHVPWTPLSRGRGTHSHTDGIRASVFPGYLHFTFTLGPLGL